MRRPPTVTSTNLCTFSGKKLWMWLMYIMVNKMICTLVMKVRRDEGTTGRRYDGTKVLRDEGTKGRRDDGMMGRWDDGTKGRRDKGTKR